MSKLATAGKILLGATSATGVALGTVALTNNTSLEQNNQAPQMLEEPKSIKELDDRVKKLESAEPKVVNVDSGLTKEVKEIKDNQNKQKANFNKEKQEVMALFDKVKQFANYGDITEFIKLMRETVSSYNSLSDRLDKAEDDFKKAEKIGLEAWNHSRQAFCAVWKERCPTVADS